VEQRQKRKNRRRTKRKRVKMTEELLKEIRTSPEAQKAAILGIDVEKVIAEAQESDRWKKYSSPATRRSIIMSKLIPAKAAATGDPFDETLLVLGGSDRFQSNFPVSFIAMRKNKTFCMLTSFDGDAFKCPCKARVVGVSNQTEYGFRVEEGANYSEVVELTFDETQKILHKAALQTRDVQKLDALKETSKNEIAIIRGVISTVNGRDVWGPKSKETGKSQKVGILPVLSPDERTPAIMRPTMGIKIDGAGSGFEITGFFDQQHHGAPVIQIEDFSAICEDAMGEPKKEDQISYVRSGIAGRNIIIGMNVFKNQEYREKRYIEGTIHFIMEVNPTIVMSDTRETLQTGAPPGDTNTPAQSETPNVEALIAWCLPLSQDPEYVPVAKVRSTLEIGDEISDAMVREIIKRASQVYQDRTKTT